MHEDYEDITSRISEPPNWYDANGTPRYGEFAPDKTPDIYTHHVGLFLIACQDCGRHFRVEIHASMWGRELRHEPKKWHYGDPPRHDCVGDTMNCEDLAVLEFWYRDERGGEWERRPEFEGVIDQSQG